jgi:signal transduction histidine kinase/ActR/RegA family two-component response regulator
MIGIQSAQRASMRAKCPILEQKDIPMRMTTRHFDRPGRIVVLGTPKIYKEIYLALQPLRHILSHVQCATDLTGKLETMLADVLILQHNPTEYDAFALCQELKKSESFLGLHILIVAADETIPTSGVEESADDIVRTPLHAGELRTRVRNSLKYRNAVKELREAHAEVESRVRLRTSELELRHAELKSEIAERTRAEKALCEMEDHLRQVKRVESLGQLAGGVAHDFNNLLFVILGYAGKILRTAPAGTMPHSAAQQIQNAGERAAELTRQLLAFGRRQVLQPRVIDLNDSVREVSEMLCRTLGEHIRLVLSCDPAARNVRVDPGQMIQVLLNLAVNARDAMPEGGTLTLETENVMLTPEFVSTHTGSKMGPHVLLSVRDTGCGMNKETLARIFEPFFTTKEIGRGTGLGLATVYGIIKQSHGNIWVKSSLGKGTRFDIYLPALDIPTDRRTRVSEVDSFKGKETVLVLENEDKVRALVCEELRHWGYRVLETADAKGAIELSRTTTLDLILSDVLLPESSGPEAVKVILALQPETKVLFMSGFADESSVHQFVTGRTAAYLQKPFSIEELSRKVRSTLDRQSV